MKRIFISGKILGISASMDSLDFVIKDTSGFKTEGVIEVSFDKAAVEDLIKQGYFEHQTKFNELQGKRIRIFIE
ncbi:MAG: hypothetical protein EPN86_02525 [Nanoarchaeota archaeon]|nr:MAG: hypothetical protein EPN86_02525 [Nanoarchaeota archaeon]